MTGHHIPRDNEQTIPDGMSVDPDWCTAKQHLTVSVCVRALMIMRTAKLLHRLVDRHRVWQHVIADQQLNAMPTAAVWYWHRSLTAPTGTQHENDQQSITSFSTHCTTTAMQRFITFTVQYRTHCQESYLVFPMSQVASRQHLWSVDSRHFQGSLKKHQFNRHCTELHGWRLSSKTWDQTISHWMRR